MTALSPYGSWKSPITTDLIVGNSISLSQPAFDGDDLYWVERRPTEEGRSTLVKRAKDGTITDLLPRSFNARTRVHEYGGGDFAVSDGILYFSNFKDQRLYRLLPGEEPQPITPEANMRYADGMVDQRRNRLLCVCEDHTESDIQAVNSIVSVRLDGHGSVEVLVSGNDFYAYPRLSPDGSRLAWLTWNHPNMPWDGTELWVADLNETGAPVNARQVAGGKTESIFQPQWSPSGQLYYVSDRTGWWNIYRLGSEQAGPVYKRDV
ncbi:MAG TPA: S9 family peptidase, partial [Ktedonobacteraceae bacterium]|nr:S9 family peptidase [Ktedonobacteraceae bacterium]